MHGPVAREEIGTVDVPITSCPLSTEDLEQFYELVDSESVLDDFGYQHYVECRELLHSMGTSQS